MGRVWFHQIAVACGVFVGQDLAVYLQDIKICTRGVKANKPTTFSGLICLSTQGTCPTQLKDAHVPDLQLAAGHRAAVIQPFKLPQKARNHPGGQDCSGEGQTWFNSGCSLRWSVGSWRACGGCQQNLHVCSRFSAASRLNSKKRGSHNPDL